MKDQGIVCRLFADDMKLCISSRNGEEIESKINNCLETLTVWLKEHQLKINIKKNSLYDVTQYIEKV